MKTVAIVLAAGRGRRMQSEIAKQYLLIRKKPVLYYSLKAFEDSIVDEIVLVTSESEQEYCQREVIDKYGFRKIKKLVVGGKERYHSVYHGLCAIEECDYVFIHDGARPFITPEMIEKIWKEVKAHPAVVAGMPAKDTVKIADRDNYVKETPLRRNVWTIQTPQTFEYALLKKAYDELMLRERGILDEGIQITDDAMVIEHFAGVKVKLVEGSYRNIKITTPEDLLVAEAFLASQTRI